MNLTRCGNGHFYDADAYQHCPHCNAQTPAAKSEMTHAVPKESNVTVGLASGTLQSAVSQAISQSAESAPSPARAGTAAPPVSGDDSLTVSLYSKSMGIEPVVGWLVAVEGVHKGKDFRLKSGKNFIGRSNSMDVALANDKTVSRDRHAIVVYEPKNHLFLIQPGDSKELCYLNNEVVLTPQVIKINDTVAVGESKLMFFPCCSDVFNWGLE
jgi:hypothetical protein